MKHNHLERNVPASLVLALKQWLLSRYMSWEKILTVSEIWNVDLAV